MKGVLFVVLFILSHLGATAQQKDPLPKAPKPIPRKDSVVTVANLAAGSSKRLHWHSGHALLSIHKQTMAGSYVDVTLNGKVILARHAATSPKPKARKLSLKAGTNTLVFRPCKSNRSESFALNISLYEKGMLYNITAQLKKGKSDTLIIIKH